MNHVELRLIGPPERVDAAVAVLRAVPGLRYVLTGRQPAGKPGAVIQYGRVVPAVPGPAAAPAQGGAAG